MSQEEGADVQVAEQSVQEAREQVAVQATQNGRAGSQVPPPETDTEKRGI